MLTTPAPAFVGTSESAAPPIGLTLMASAFVKVSLPLGLAIFVASIAAAAAAPPVRTAAPDPGACKSAFDCGRLSAHLGGKEDDYVGAFKAIRRGCEIETTAPNPGDSLFACEQYAELLISAGKARGGDPAKGMSMLEEMCKARPDSTNGAPSPCGTLAREYDRPPKASGLARQADKAAALQSTACNKGDALACDALGDILLKGGPNVPADPKKARAAYDKGCAGSDHYAAGVCGAIGSKLAEGKLGDAPDRAAAMPYLKKSCAQGYRCDLYVAFLLQDGKSDEAVRVFDQPSSFRFDKQSWAQKFCKDGHTVMCSRANAPKSPSSSPF